MSLKLAPSSLYDYNLSKLKVKAETTDFVFASYFSKMIVAVSFAYEKFGDQANTHMTTREEPTLVFVASMFTATVSCLEPLGVWRQVAIIGTTELNQNSNEVYPWNCQIFMHLLASMRPSVTTTVIKNVLPF